MIDHASAKVSDANATETHARNSQTLAELEHRDSLAAWVAEAFKRSSHRDFTPVVQIMTDRRELVGYPLDRVRSEYQPEGRVRRLNCLYNRTRRLARIARLLSVALREWS